MKYAGKLVSMKSLLLSHFLSFAYCKLPRASCMIRSYAMVCAANDLVAAINQPPLVTIAGAAPRVLNPGTVRLLHCAMTPIELGESSHFIIWKSYTIVA